MNMLRMSLQLERTQRVHSALEAAIHNPDTTPARMMKTIKYIYAEMKKVIKNLSCGRSTDDVLHIGHQVGGVC